MKKQIYNIKLLDRNLCAGCGMCSNLCPIGAITMKADDEGFLFPEIDDKCTQCGLCAKRCPQLSSKKNAGGEAACFAVQANESLRSSGSSGGVFAALAEKIIEKKGAVCGAAFEEGCYNLSHVTVTEKDSLPKLYKSKYLQSNSGNIYLEIKQRLEKGQNVLFSGCPCQIDALQAFLGKEYPNLITVDILCYGVPSPLAYKKFLDEVRDKNDRKNIVAVDFRDKKYGWGTLISIVFSDKTIHYDYYNGNYFRAFLSGLSMRESCYHCQYSQFNRVGDITLGDFWGVKNYKTALDDGKGTSLVICNTSKGKRLLEDIKNRFAVIERVSDNQVIEISKKANAALVRPTNKPKMRQCFFNHLKKGDSFSVSLRYAETSLLDVGILGWWNETPRSNYGSTLTNFALYRYILSLGLSVAMVSPPNFDRKYAGEFNKRYGYRMTAKYALQNMKENNKYIDTFIVASDVLWYYDAFIKTGYFFMLDFVDADKRKISYATSFGNTERFFPQEEILKVHTLLNRFDNVSVREYEGVEICKNRLGVSATQVLDPVFICDKANYDELADNAERKTKSRFLFAYMLDPAQEKAEILGKIAKKLHLQLVTITDKQFNAEEKVKILRKYGIIEHASIEELVYHIKNAEFVITDSYHGMCFSLIFRKTFLALVNRARGASRFDTLAEDFKIKERMLENLHEALEKEYLLQAIDYNNISERIEEETERSKHWLNSALFTGRKKEFSDFDLLLEETLEIKDKLANVIARLDRLEKKGM